MEFRDSHDGDKGEKQQAASLPVIEQEQELITEELAEAPQKVVKSQRVRLPSNSASTGLNSRVIQMD